MQSNTKIPASELYQMIEGTHPDNLLACKERVEQGKWHWLLPDHWVESDENKAVLFHAINMALLSGKQ